MASERSTARAPSQSAAPTQHADASGPAMPGAAGAASSPTGVSRRRTRIIRLAVALGLTLPVVAAIALVTGGAGLAPADAIQSVLARLGVGHTPLSAVEDALVWEWRVPRIVGAAAIGAGLALAGVVMQSVTRNPLADPYLLGLSSGAAFGAVSVVLLGVALVLPVAAFIGAMLALALTLGIARATGRITPTRTILAGVAVSAFASAATSLVVFLTATGDAYREILGWLLGTLATVRWPTAILALVATAIAGIVLTILARRMDAFAFGDTHASSLGIAVGRTRLVLLTLAAALTGILVSVAGAIGFVGLVVPHAVRLLVGPGHRALVPLSMLGGAAILMLADTLARVVLDPRELPVGVVTALIGAPVFALLLARKSA